jgi:hypothetical protein
VSKLHSLDVNTDVNIPREGYCASRWPRRNVHAPRLVRSAGSGGGRMPAVKIDLHIHLPENKTARDYDSIIQDIAKYIYGRNVADRG